MHYEKNNAGSPKVGQDYELFAKIFSIIRRKWEVHGICRHFLTIPKHLRNICNNWYKNHAISYKIPVLCCLCTLHVNYLENVTRISHTITISNTIHLKAQSFLQDFQNYLHKKWVFKSKQTQNITLCQQDLKGCRINTKFGFGEELSMQSNFIKSVQSVSSWSLCESREAKSLSEKISKVRKI